MRNDNVLFLRHTFSFVVTKLFSKCGLYSVINFQFKRFYK